MFETFTPIRGSLWRQRVNSGLGTLFLCSFALWAGLIMLEFRWGVNPIAQAMASAIMRETTLP
jgi:hypothetical protein